MFAFPLARSGSLFSLRLSPVPPLGSLPQLFLVSLRSPGLLRLLSLSFPRLALLAKVSHAYPRQNTFSRGLVWDIPLPKPRVPRSSARECALTRVIVGHFGETFLFSLPPACSPRPPPFFRSLPRLSSRSPLRSFPGSLPASCSFPGSLFPPKCPTRTHARIRSLAGWCGTSPFPSPVSHAHRPENALSRGWLWDTLAKLTDVPLIGPKVPKPHRYGNFGEPTTDCKKKVLQKLGKTAATPHLCK